MISSNTAPANPLGVNVPSFELLPLETAFIAYTCKKIKQLLGNKGMIHVFLCFDAKMQSSFKNWVEINIIQRTLSDNEIDLHVIVNSIWEKTKNYIESVMNITQNHQALTDQNLALSKGDLMTADLIKKGYEGKAFTFFQASVLLDISQKAGWL